MRDSIDWRRLLGEFVVIVVGVLVALGVDEWRGTLSDNALERQYLGRLESDLRQGRVTLDSTRLRLAGADRNGQFVEPYLWGRAGIPGDTASTIAALYGASRSLAVGLADNLPQTTFAELQSTGRIGLLRSVPLRTAIQDYYNEVNRTGENLSLLPREYRDFVRRLMPPALQATIRSECPVEATADLGQIQCTIPLGDYDARELLHAVEGNTSLAGDLNLSRQQLSISVGILAHLLTRTDSVLELLEQEGG